VILRLAVFENDKEEEHSGQSSSSSLKAAVVIGTIVGLLHRGAVWENVGVQECVQVGIRSINSVDDCFRLRSTIVVEGLCL